MLPRSLSLQKLLTPHSKRNLVFTLLMIVSVGGAHSLSAIAQISQPTPTTQSTAQATQNRSLSLEDAIEVAEQNNQDLKIARLRVQQSEESLKAAKANKLPIVSATGSLFRSENSTFQANPGGAINTAEQGRIQQQTAANAQQQRQLARFQFQQQLQRLQSQLQRDTDLSQQDNVNQQISELAQRANQSTQLPVTGGETPFSPFQGFNPSTSIRINDGIRNTIQSNVSVNYNILTGGQRSAQIRAVRKQLELSKLDVLRLRQQLRLNVANDYFDLQEVRALMRVALSAVTNAEQTKINTELTEQAGLSTKFEILQADVQLANAQQNLNLAEGLQQTAQRQLAETLSLEPTVRLVPSDEVAPRGEWATALPKSIVTALKNRVELQQILLNRDIEKESRIIVRAAKRPNLTSFAGLTASASSVANQAREGFEGGINYNVGLQVSLNAFDGGEIKAQLKEINERIKIAETQYDDQKNTIRLAVETSYSALQQNGRNIVTSQGALGLAEESLELARLRLKAGIGTQLDVIQAETDLTQAQGNVISAVLDYNRALASIARETAYVLPIEDN